MLINFASVLIVAVPTVRVLQPFGRRLRPASDATDRVVTYLRGVAAGEPGVGDARR